MSKSSSRCAIMITLGVLPVWVLFLALTVPPSLVLAEDQPNGSTIVSPQTTDGTWGPGVITATSNVVINAGVTITIAPGTTVVVNGNYALTVNGTLRVNGPVTFTHPSATPGAWQGIIYAPGSAGYLDGVTIEYAQRGLTLNTANRIIVSNSTIRYNRHTVSGAGVYLQSGDHQITGTLIYNNQVQGSGVVYGGGVFIENNSSHILHSRIYSNTVTSTGNRGGGAGVMIRQSSGVVAPLIEGCEVTTNTLRTAGSSGLANGAGIGIEGVTQAVIRHNWIADNQSVPTAGYGGGGGIGFEQDARASLIDRNVIANNLSMGPGHSEGGGIDLWAANVVTVTNNLLYNNRSRTIGGGMNINANVAAGDVNVINNTIIGNTSADGGGLYRQSGGRVFNNIVVGNTATNTGGGIFGTSGAAGYNDVWNNTPNNYSYTPPATDLQLDPLFLGTGDLVERYHLQDRSPAIDKGTNTGIGLPALDYDGDARPLFCSWDMGFDEVIVGPSTIQCMIDLAAPGETVLVPAGVYTESLRLTKPVSVTGVSSATVIVRAPANQRVLYVTGTVVTNDVLIADLTFENGNTTASGGAVYVTGGAQPRFEALTFRNNTARYRGGAIFMDSPGATLIVRRSHFTGNQVNYNNDANTRGAAIAVQGAASQLILEDSVLSNNTSERYGGAIAVEGNVTPAHLAITDSLINDNTALEVDGGAIFGNLAVITVTRSTLDNNRAPANDRMGGAVYLTGVGSALTLDGSTLSNNLGFRQGGAIYASGNDIRINVLNGSRLTGNATADNDTYAYGGAIYLSGNRAALTISASDVCTNTSANYGGAIYVDGNSDTDQARLTITDSQINANEATLYNGGGIWADQTLISIANSTVDHNRAPTAGRLGGGIYLTGLNTSLALDHTSVSGNLVGRAGAGIYASGNYIQMTVQNGSAIDGNESTEDNDLAQGGGIYLYGIGVRLDIADSSIADNIAERFGGGVYLSNNSTTIPGQLTVTRSQVSRNEATDRSGGGLYAYQSAVTITQSTLSDNRAPDVSGDWAGGALYLAGAGANLTVLTSTLTGNTAAAYGGGIYLSNSAAQVIIANSVISDNRTLRNVTANTGGGGFYLGAAGASRLTVADSVFANNLSERAGGALFYYGATNSVLTVTDSRFTDNRAANLHGGGLYVRQAATTLTRVVVGGNTALAAGADGGGLYFEGSGAASTLERVEILNNRADDLGGGLYAGSTLTLRNATVSGNATNNRGGGLYAAGGTLTVYDSTLAQNATHLAVDGDGGALYTAVNTTISNTQILSNTANDDGGGLYTSAGVLSLTDSALNGNTTGAGADADGGALYVNGNATLTRVTLRGNTANRYGGGLYRANGDITLNQSTLAENIAGNSGGALYMGGGTLTTANSTFSGNHSGADGGALWINTNANLYNTTMFNNTATGLGGGIRRATAGTVTFRNSLVAGNSPVNCSGTIGTGGTANLADDATCGSNFTNNLNAARLGPLADNGGATFTHLLLPGNPAINAGNAAICAAAPVNGVDQRGVSRPQGAQCDIGAVEATARLALSKHSANEGGDPLRPGERITYTLVLVNDSPLPNTGVVITDAAPAHTTFIPGSLTVEPPSAGGTPGTPPVLVEGLTVAADSTVTVTFAVLADCPLDTGDLIVNTADARSDQVSGPLSSTVTDTVVATPQVQVIKQGPATADVGSTVVYTFSVTNPGDTRLHNLAVQDDLTGAALYVSGDDGNGWLDLSETWVYTTAYTVQTTAPNLITNTVLVTATDAAGVVVTDSDTHTLDVVYNPALRLVKTGLAQANVGETVTFTFTVGHAALSDGSAVSGLTVTDDIAGSAAYLSGDDGDGLLQSGETWVFTAAYTLQVTDPDPLVNTATAAGLDAEGDPVSVTATHSLDINLAPVAVDDTAATDEETSVNVAVLANDNDPDGDPLVITGVETTGTLGNVTNNINDVTYDPGTAFQYLGSGESAVDTFRYTITDGVFTATATVTVTVTGINDAPVAVDDVATTDENTPITVDVLVNDGDVDLNDTLTVTGIDTIGTLGSVINNGVNVSYDPGTAFRYLAVGESATDVFTYTVADGNGGLDTAVVTVTVSGINNDPVAVDDTAITDEDTVLLVVAPGVLANDSDPDVTDTLSVVGYDPLSAGGVQVVVNGDGRYSYDPTTVPTVQALAVGQTLQDTFVYTITDGHGAIATAMVTVTVEGQNDVPVAMDDLSVTDEDTPVLIYVLGNDSDIDGDTLVVSNVTQPINGIAFNMPDRVIYFPPLHFNGVVTFTYTADDGHGGFSTAWVTVTVSAVNDPPVAVNDNAVTDEDTPITIDVLANDIDPDGDTLTVTGVTQPAHGVVINHGSDVTYTPNPDYHGPDSFAYTISDGSGTDVGFVEITVRSVNDVPVAVDDTATTTQDTPVTVNVLANDSDVDGEPLTIASLVQPANGVAAVNPDWTITYTPTTGFVGTDELLYTVSDGNGGTAMARLTITVVAVNTPPLAVDDLVVVDETDTPVTILVLANDADVDGDPLVVYDVGVAGNGTATHNGSHVTYTPFSGWAGTDVFTYTVSDGNGGFDSAWVTVTVNAVYHSLTVHVIGNGSVNKMPDASTYRHNTAITLTAVPDPQWSFSGWSGALSGTTNPAWLILNADRVVTATFVYEGYRPLLQVVKAGPDTAEVGQTVVYTFTVWHAAGSDGSPAGQITVEDDVAGMATRLAGDDGDDLLESGEIWVYTVSYTVRESDLGQLINTVIVRGHDGDGDEISASDSHTTAIGQAVAPRYRVYLPLAMRNSTGEPQPGPNDAPDLVVESIVATQNSVTIVIKNQGTAPVNSPFWVDLYVDPHPVPTAVNQLWYDGRCAQGAVWAVGGNALPINPGQTRTLAVGDAYYRPALSSLVWPLPVGTPIYVQVDSANANTSFGAVLESHEIGSGPYNNVGGPSEVLPGAAAIASPLWEPQWVPDDEFLPPR